VLCADPRCAGSRSGPERAGVSQPAAEPSTEPVTDVMTEPLSGVVLVTGTGTDVGKTVVTAALAGAALAAGRRVCVVKPVQTGVGPGEPGDLAEVVRLLGAAGARLVTREFVRLPEPLAPQAAARLAGVSLPALTGHAERIAALAADFDLVLVEGAGGLLVRLDDQGGTLAELAGLLAGALDSADEAGTGAEEAGTGAGADGTGLGAGGTGAVLVTGPELGTLNVTELTVEALRHRGVPVIGLVIGRWPTDPGLAELGNLSDLPRLTGVRLLGVIPAGPPLPPAVQPVPRTVHPAEHRQRIDQQSIDSAPARP
jgi:dethiobiotin synthetase